MPRELMTIDEIIAAQREERAKRRQKMSEPDVAARPGAPDPAPTVDEAAPETAAPADTTTGPVPDVVVPEPTEAAEAITPPPTEPTPPEAAPAPTQNPDGEAVPAPNQQEVQDILAASKDMRKAADELQAGLDAIPKLEDSVGAILHIIKAGAIGGVLGIPEVGQSRDAFIEEMSRDHPNWTFSKWREKDEAFVRKAYPNNFGGDGW